MESKAPDWVEFDSGKWLVGTMEMDAMTEFVYFRLCLHAYEKGTSVVKGSDRRNAGRCKVDLETYQEAIEMLVEMEKIEILGGDEIYIPTTEKRLNKASSAMNNRQIGAAKSRRRIELKQSGMDPAEIDRTIQAEFPDIRTDDQSDDQSPKERKETKKQTKGGVGGKNDQEVEQEKTPKGPAFIDFWSVVPKRISKARAEKAWSRLSIADRQMALDRCVAWHRQWRKEHPHAAWIHPSTYLNEKRFNDESSGRTPEQNAQAREALLNNLAKAIITGEQKFLLKDVKRETIQALIDTNRVTPDQVRKAGL